MANNPYAPPKATVVDMSQVEDVSPPLWNPNAAANWSLLFSPAFGAFLHMKNWQALGEPRRASSSKVWAVLSLILIVGLSLASALMPGSKSMDGVIRIIGLVLLFGWYFSAARAQARYVKEHFADSYPKRGWAKPLFFAVLALIGFIAVVAGAAFVGVVATDDQT